VPATTRNAAPAVKVTATERFADFSLGLDRSAVPAPVEQAVGLHLLDVLGCGLAAAATGAVPYVAALGEGSGPSTAIGIRAGLPPETAALINGISCHALDFDDTHPGSIAHVSAVVAPAALAAAQAAATPGSELMLALLVGNEVTCRVGRPVADAFHERGFHSTAICGVFGATAATARLTGLDRERTVQAFGIAGSMAAGLMAYLSDGSATKPIHPGWMAHAAHIAVRLAAAGAHGPAAVLEGRNGVYDAFVGRRDVAVDVLTADLGSSWETPNIAFKPYAACHFLHAPLDALFELRAERDFEVGDIVRITVLSPRAGIGLIGHPLTRKRRPATPYEAKFSAPFALAAALVLGRADPSIFAGELFRDPRLLAVADLVDYEERDYDSFPESIPGGVLIELRNGELLERNVLHQRGGVLSPMDADAVIAKYRENASMALPADRVESLELAALGLDGGSLDAFEDLADAREGEAA
jgi:2-methylcitrate dehydratase PrpD